jgi:hypothetical protein
MNYFRVPVTVLSKSSRFFKSSSGASVRHSVSEAELIGRRLFKPAEGPHPTASQTPTREVGQNLKTSAPSKDLSQASKPIGSATKNPAETLQQLSKSAAKPKVKPPSFDTFRRSMQFPRVPGVPVFASDASSLRQMSNDKEVASPDWHEIGNLVNGAPKKVDVGDIRELARDPKKLDAVFDKVSKLQASEGAVYNDPCYLWSEGHAYLVYKRIPITPEQHDKLSKAGPLNQHIVDVFPNGSEVLKGGTDRAERMRLGAAAEVIISEKGSHEAGDGKRIDKHLASTSSEHPLDGDAVHAARLEKDAVTVLIVGAGRSNVPTVDWQNNQLSQKLWCTVGELAVAHALDPKNYQDSLPQTTKTNLKELENSDKLMSLAGVYARKAFGQNTAETVESMTKESIEASQRRASLSKVGGDNTLKGNTQASRAPNSSLDSKAEILGENDVTKKNQEANQKHEVGLNTSQKTIGKRV